MTAPEEMHPILKAIVRGGGGKDHDLLKLVGYLWLMDRGCDIVDCEAGGFDVLGIELAQPGKYARDPLDRLHSRTVIDAKASMGDLLNHFRKESIPRCDINGKFSALANYHYIIARRGVVKVDAVHSPWGLLEHEGGAVTVAKSAEYRAYVGGNEDLIYVSVRATKLLSSFMKTPSHLEEVKKSLPAQTKKLLSSEDGAKNHIRSIRKHLSGLCTTFEVLYGYSPFRERDEEI